VFIALCAIAIAAEVAVSILRVRASLGRRILWYDRSLAGQPRSIQLIGTVSFTAGTTGLAWWLWSYFHDGHDWPIGLLCVIWPFVAAPAKLIHNARLPKTQQTYGGLLPDHTKH
jgi:hypothetical protein